VTFSVSGSGPIKCDGLTDTVAMSGGVATCKVTSALTVSGSPKTAQATYSGDGSFATSYGVLTVGIPAAVPPVSATTTSTARVTYDSVVMGDRPVAFWNLNLPGGAEPDLTRNGHDGTYRGGTPILTTLPNGDTVVDLNGLGEYLTVPSSPAFSVATTRELTWEAWIRPDVLQWSSKSDPEGHNYVDWMGKCQSFSPSCEWEARMYSSVNPQGRCNRISAYLFNPGAGLGSGAFWQPTCNTLRPGKWLHVVGEYQTVATPSPCDPAYPGTINIWVNGVEQDFAAHQPTGCVSQFHVTPQSNGSPLDIGTTAFKSWFPGAIGKVAIYDYLLTQAQIANHFFAMTSANPSGSCSISCTILQGP
jgi:hypothetical protein